MLTKVCKKINPTFKWLHAGLYREAALLECHSSENFLRESDIEDLMRSTRIGGFVVTEYNKAIGYTIYEQVGLNVEIINLVVHQDYRRQGVGKILVEKLMTRKDCKRLFASVRETNLSAQLFLRSQNFLATKIQKNYFEDHRLGDVNIENAYLFEKEN